MIEALYTREVLRLAAAAPSGERLEQADVAVTKTSRICGSRITIEVKFNNGRVSEYAQTIRACALGQASATIVARHIIGKTLKDIAPVAEAVGKLLREAGPPPGGEWADFKVFIPARQHKSRHSAIMLPFEALHEAFGCLEKKSAR
ncbi:MAG: iron-sulfur cluster assembly scaffold protein [Proteobacteria bacterium]|nr:iron-sulfur cluster assembly scaffold protein [Pseudomonadota bacterium]